MEAVRGMVWTFSGIAQLTLVLIKVFEINVTQINAN